jgi:hypothetical protein
MLCGGRVTAVSAGRLGPGEPDGPAFSVRKEHPVVFRMTISARSREYPDELRRSAHQLGADGNPSSRRRPHQQKCRLDKQPMETDRASNCKYGGG